MPLIVSPEVEALVRERIEKGFYRDVDEVLSEALHIMRWAANHPRGRRELFEIRCRLDAKRQVD
jgi:hypothetical protein